MPVVVIGGGITGLSAAWELSKHNGEVVLIEPGPFGGLLRSERIEDCVVECGADSWLTAKPSLRSLAVEAGLESDVIPCDETLRQTFILRGGKLHAFPRGMRMVAPTEWKSFCESGLLTPAAKLRMLLETRRQPLPAGEAPGDRTVAEFVRDHFGDEAVEYLAEPIFAGVYGGSPETLGVASVLPRLLEHERVHGSVIRGALRDPQPSPPLFQSMRQGLGQIPEALAALLSSRIKILRVPAESVEPGRVRAAGDWIPASQVLIASGAHSAAALLSATPAGRLLSEIRHSSATIFIFGFERDDFAEAPRGFGFLVPRRERRTIIGATWVTNKFPQRAPASKVLVRCFVAGDHTEALLDDVLADFARITGNRARPRFTRVYRWPNSLPQYGVGHAAFIRQLEASLPPGVHLAGAFLRGIGMPDCAKSGLDAAQAIIHAASPHLAAGTSPGHSPSNPRSNPPG